MAGYTSYMANGPAMTAYRPIERPDGSKARQPLDAGKNPPLGVVIHYAFAEQPQDEVTLTILDGDGHTIRSFSSKSVEGPRVPVEAGANRFVWDLRYPKPTALENGEKKATAFARMLEEGVAPRALPGDYEVRLTVGEATLAQRFTIAPDLRLATTPEELRAQFELKVAIRDRLSEVHETINSIRRLRKQLDGWIERAKTHERGECLRERAAALKEKLLPIEEALINLYNDRPQPGPAGIKDKLASLSLMIDESDDAPTQSACEVFAQLSEQAGTERARFDHLLAEDVEALNRLIGELGLAPVGL